MRIALIADIHSNLEALRAILKEIERESPDKILCVGDICGYGADPSKCLEQIRELKITSVKGNHDHGVVSLELFGFNPFAATAIEWQARQLSQQELNFISKLPERALMTIGGYKIYLIHGSPKNPLWGYVYEDDVNEGFIKDLDSNLVIMGHTHIPFVKLIGNKLVINPGSVGQPRDGNPKASFAIFDTESFGARIFRVSYDVEVAASKIIKAGLPKVLGQRLFLGQ